MATFLMAIVFPPLAPLVMGAAVGLFAGSIAKKAIKTRTNLAEESNENETYKKSEKPQKEASVRKEKQQDLSLQEMAEGLLDTARYRRTMEGLLTPSVKKRLNKDIAKMTKKFNKALNKANLPDDRMQKFMDNLALYSEKQFAALNNNPYKNFLNASNKLDSRPENNQKNTISQRPLMEIKTTRQVKQQRRF